MNNPGVGASRGTTYDLLTRRFRDLAAVGDYVVHYELESTIPGTRLLFHDEKNPVARVTMRDGLPLVFIKSGDTGRWCLLRNGTLEESFAPQDTGVALGSASVPDDPLASAIQTADGKWTLAALVAPDARLRQLFRLDRARTTRTRFDLPADHYYRPLAFLPAAGKFLFADILPDSFGKPDRYLLADPETLEKVLADFFPLTEWGGHAAQSAGLDSVWVYGYDRETRETVVASFNLRTVHMETVARLPDVFIGSSERQLWVDASAGKVFVIINDDLLEVPLPPSTATTPSRR